MTTPKDRTCDNCRQHSVFQGKPCTLCNNYPLDYSKWECGCCGKKLCVCDDPAWVDCVEERDRDSIIDLIAKHRRLSEQSASIAMLLDLLLRWYYAYHNAITKRKEAASDYTIKPYFLDIYRATDDLLGTMRDNGTLTDKQCKAAYNPPTSTAAEKIEGGE